MSWEKLAAIALLVISSLVVCWTFEVWAAAFLGVLFAISLNGPGDWIRSRWPMPVWASTLLTMLMVLVVLAGLGFVIGPPIVKQADELGTQLPGSVETSLEWLEERKWGRTVLRQVESLVGMSEDQLDIAGEANDGPQALQQGVIRGASEQQPLAGERSEDSSQAGPNSDASDHVTSGGRADSDEGHGDNGENNAEDEAANGEDGEQGDEGSGNGDSGDQVRSMVLAILKALGKMLSVSAWAMMLLLVSFVVTMYIALNPDIYRRGILWMIPAEHEAVATQTMDHISVALRWWMLGRLVSMSAVGLLTSLGMWLIGMPAPLALGTLAGLLSFVPNIGPIIAAAPGLLLAVPDGSWMFFSALGVYVVAQLIESNLLTPLVDKYTVATPPAVLIFTQVIMGVLAGAWGAVVASPFLVVVLVLTQQLYVREYIKKPIRSIGTTET